MIARSIFIIVLLLQSAKAQNLIHNSSFEDTLAHGGFCMTNIEFADHWFNPTNSTPDLFCYNMNSANCTVSSMNNGNGYQLPRTGTSYAGIYIWQFESREYIAIKLDSLLSENCIYYIEFYVSNAEGFIHATDNIGCAFVSDTSNLDTTVNYLPIPPAIESPQGVIISDTQQWVKISGFYEALGNEQFFLIGNFHDAAHTTVAAVNPSIYAGAYYYIDDITILTCDSTASMVGINTISERNKIQIYPNPARDFINVNYNGTKKFSIAELFEQSGKLLFRQKLRNVGLQEISVEANNSGCYLLKIHFTDGEVENFKLIIFNSK